MSSRPHILLISANRHKEPYPVYPLGVSYLKSYLARRLPAYEVAVFDCNLGSQGELEEMIQTLNPRYVGISFRNMDGANSLCKGNFMAGYREVANTVRRATTSPLIIGGAGFSIFPQHFMAQTGADYGLAGEGEESLAQLIERLDAALPTQEVDGLFSAETIPENYPEPHKCYLRSLEVEFEDRWVDYYWRHSGMLNIQTKRGCPYHCVYCSYPVIDGRVTRTLDPEKIVDDIIRLRSEKGVDYLFFTDSVFNICADFNAQLAEELIRREAKIRWGAYFSPSSLTPDMLSLYRRSGLTHVEFGSESFDDQVLESYGKRFTFSDILHASEMCLSESIYYSHFLILGGVGETMQSVARTINNSRQIRHSVFFPYVGMRIYPYTELHTIAMREGIIEANDTLVDPRYYICSDFDLEHTRQLARDTGKAWIFPDDEGNQLPDKLRLERNKKGPLWEYLRRP